MIKKAIVCVLALLAVSTASTDSVSAQPSGVCDSVVSDEAGILGSGRSRVEAAARALERQGAEVRVVTVRSYGPHANLDDLKADIQSGCRSWQSADGGMKNNLIVFLMSMEERKTGLYYGDQWRARLDARWPTLLSGKVVPRFRDGEFAGGIADGLTSVAGVIAPKAETVSGGTRQTTVVHEAPTDLSGLWLVLGIGLGIGAFVLLVNFILGRRKHRAERRAAQRDAKIERTSCSQYVLDLEEPLEMANVRVNRICASVSESDARPIRERYEKASLDLRNASARFTELDQADANPERDGLTVEEYRSIGAKYKTLLDDLNGVRKDIDGITRDYERLSALVDAAPALIVGTQSKVALAGEVIAEMESRGYRTEEARAVLKYASYELALAESSLAAKDFGSVGRHTTTASEEAEKAVDAAERLLQIRQDIEERQKRVSDGLSDTASAIKDGRAVFETIASEYAESSWETIRGNGTEAEKRLVAATEAVPKIQGLASMKVQDWNAAAALASDAGSWLDQANSLMQSVHELKRNLDAAKEGAREEVRLAEEDIDAARAFVAKNDADVRDSLVDDLERARYAIVEAIQELEKAKPDYIVVVKRAKTANEMADRALTTARSDVEAAERKRRKAVTSLREAERSVSAAKEYIEDHASDVVGSTASGALREARGLLTHARSATDIDDRIRLAVRCDEAADLALSSAQSVVRREEARREEERRRRRREEERRAAERRRRDDDDSFGGGISIGGSGGFGGWGSSSGGGGGSVSWGGSGSSSGGGGSVGW